MKVYSSSVLMLYMAIQGSGASLSSDDLDRMTANQGTPISVAYALEINVPDTKGMHEWMEKQTALRKAEVRIDIDGVSAEMSFAEFKCRMIEHHWFWMGCF